jgi:hypothetical protein
MRAEPGAAPNDASPASRGLRHNREPIAEDPSMLAAFPLLSITLLIANVIAFGSDAGFSNVVMTLGLPSEGTLSITSGDCVILLGLILLYFEIFKATRTGSATIIDHALSLLVFIVALVEFLIVPAFAHPAFLALLLMTLIDVVAGFTVTISGARRDFAAVGQ